MPISSVSGYNTIQEYNDNYLKPIREGRPEDVKKPAEVNRKDEENKTPFEKRNECETCKNRKYVDGSNESDVSFKAPTHVSPEASTAAVLSHEGEHVSNAIAKGSEEGNELVSVSVSVRYERCPECGRVYAAGGLTHSVMKTSKPNYGSTGYGAAQKTQDYSATAGGNVDVNA